MFSSPPRPLPFDTAAPLHPSSRHASECHFPVSQSNSLETTYTDTRPSISNMVKSLLLAICATTGAHALWLAAVNMDYGSAVGTAIFNSPYCQVGKGNTEAEALSKASNTVGGTIIIAGGHCDQLPYQHTNQLGGFWDDYGTINYEDDNWHWYCNPGHTNRNSCDAGNGSPKKKRAVKLTA